MAKTPSRRWTAWLRRAPRPDPLAEVKALLEQHLREVRAFAQAAAPESLAAKQYDIAVRLTEQISEIVKLAVDEREQEPRHG